ncbi:MAG TPA: diguanylate cyclase [Candidatus Acidoferrum sp.]|nr:diguanylate cyclase [Candidatus Acidoferrum sp.]
MTRRRLRVLLAEGSPGEVSEALRSLYANTDPGLELTVVSTIATLMPTIKIVDPEVILLDLSLSLREARDAVHLVHRTAPGVPLIVFVDASEKAQGMRSLTEGAMDFLLKGHIDAPTLERVLRAALERNTLSGLTDLLRDQVTGLYTRDGFLTVGERRLEEAMRAASSLVLICALIENLQALRQAFGPGTADRALSDVARLLTGCCRRSDVVGRLGESQFAILGVGAAAPSAPVMRNRLEQHIAVHNQTRSPWGPIEIRTSIGSWAPPDGGNFADFLDGIESRLRTDADKMTGERLLQT